MAPLPAGIGPDVRPLIDHEDTTLVGRVFGPTGDRRVRHREAAPVPLHGAGDPLGRTPRPGRESRRDSEWNCMERHPETLEALKLLMHARALAARAEQLGE